jgi:hypothetical protein
MRTVKVLSLLFVSLMLFQFYAVAPVANATPNLKLIQVSGEVNILPGQILWTHTSRDIIYIIAYQNASFLGSFKGLVVIRWFITENWQTGEMKTHGVGTFTGKMDGKSGTFTFTTFGWGIDPTFHNEWKILKGTGGFSNIHGSGTLDGDLETQIGSYSGSIYFRP